MTVVRGNRNATERIADGGFRAIFGMLLLVSMFPFYWMVMSSLKTQPEIFSNPLGPPAAPNFGNYAQSWVAAGVPLAFFNSLLVAVSSVLLVLVTAAPAAFALARLRMVARTVLLGIFVSGLIVAPEVVLIPLFNGFSRLGLINSPLSVILTHAAFSMPLAIFLFWQFFRDIPGELQEAARIDGCSDFRFFLAILLPLSKPVLGSVVIFTGLASWNEYLFALTYLRDDSVKTLPIKLTVFFGQFSTNWPLLFAFLVMGTVPIILLYLLLQGSFVRGLTAGAIKG